MTKLSRTVFVLAAILLMTATVMADETTVKEMSVPVVKCSAPVGTLSILDVDCKAAACQDTGTPRAGLLGLAQLFSGAGGVQGVGKGVGAMLSNALKETGCFKIIDLEKVKAMQARLEATGQKIAPPKIDHVVAGTITAIEYSKEGGALLGGIVPVVGLVSKNTEKAQMTMEVSVLDPATTEVTHSKTFAADSSKSSWGFALGGYRNAGLGGGGWSISKSLSMDKVTQEVVFSAANYIAESLAGKNIVSRPVIPKKEEDNKSEENQ